MSDPKIDLEQYRVRGEEISNPIEYVKITRNSKAINYEFCVVGKPEEMYDRIKGLMKNLSVICAIERVKKKVEEFKREELELQ